MTYRPLSPHWIWSGAGASIRSTLRTTHLEAALKRENNNFDLLRVLAASAVLVGHSYLISPRDGYVDPMKRLIGFNYSGGLAVMLFFFLSGVLVVDSYRRNPQLIRFGLARIARIFPGLVACLFITVTIVGPVFTSLRVGDYFAASGTSSYFFNNLLLTNLQWRLPGVFIQSAYGLNGSLWTLPTEIRLYAGVALLGALRILSFRWVASLILAGMICAFCVLRTRIHFLTETHDLALLSVAFVTGAICAINKRWVPFSGWMVAGFWIVTAIAWGGPAKEAAFYASFLYTCVFIFQLPGVCKLRLPGDYSYGIYIYGFVVQQCVNALFPGCSPWFNAAIAVPVCLLLGAISWHMLEKPCLLWIKRLRLPGFTRPAAAHES